MCYLQVQEKKATPTKRPHSSPSATPTPVLRRVVVVVVVVEKWLSPPWPRRAFDDTRCLLFDSRPWPCRFPFCLAFFPFVGRGPSAPAVASPGPPRLRCRRREASPLASSSDCAREAAAASAASAGGEGGEGGEEGGGRRGDDFVTSLWLLPRCFFSGGAEAREAAAGGSTSPPFAAAFAALWGGGGGGGIWAALIGAAAGRCRSVA